MNHRKHVTTTTATTNKSRVKVLVSLCLTGLAFLLFIGIIFPHSTSSGSTNYFQRLRDAYVSPHQWLQNTPHDQVFFAPVPFARHPQMSIGMRRILSPPPIKINSSLPDIDGLATGPGTLHESWTNAVESLSNAANEAIESTFHFNSPDADPEKEIHGVPGTNITSDTEAAQLQGYLDCVTGLGEWVFNHKGDTSKWEEFGHAGEHGTTSTARHLTVHKHDPSFATCDKKFYKGRSPNFDTRHDWDVRDSLKFRFKPDKGCQSLLPSHMVPPEGDSALDRTQFCKLLRHKNILIAGDSATSYILHDLILDWTLEKPVTCYGDLYCNMHLICSNGLRQDGPLTDGSWHKDERVYNHLPEPENAWSDYNELAEQLQLQQEQDQDQELEQDQEQEQEQDQDQEQDQEQDQQAVAKRSFFPGYQASHPFGTILRFRRSDGLYMSMKERDAAHNPVYINPATGIREINNIALPDARKSDVVVIGKSPLPLPSSDSSSRGSMSKWTDKLLEGTWSGENKAAVVAQAAEAITKEVWLPELMQSLYQLRRGGSPSDLLIIWKSAWRTQGECGMESDAMDILDEPADPRNEFDWIGWWNGTNGDGQVPPIRKPPSLYRLTYSGYPTIGTLTDVHTLFYNYQVILQNHIVRNFIAPKLGLVFLDLETPMSIWRSGLIGGGDCLRPCLPSPGYALEHAFMGGLQSVFAWGWEGPGRRQDWMGDEYIPVREREKIRKSMIQSESSGDAQDQPPSLSSPPSLPTSPVEKPAVIKL